ncbi:MAG: hypothetical protein HYX76_09365 [Acidobacteria bacterium]|nr:hypothetical protein [Acidobacteriota bacterium]
MLLTTGAIAAQQRPVPPEAGQGDLLPTEIQRLFDAYAVVQAQEMLKLDDAQYGPFVTRLKALQETRRRNQRARAQLLQQLMQLANQDASGEETVLRERLKAYREHELGAATDVQKAYDAIDQILNIRQQARFRMFEEQMERRKFDLLLRARQANRLARPGRARPR